MYDCIVIGGGPSGLMAAISCAEQKKRVLLIDKGNKLGRKLAISGGGRCNVTNRMPVEELIKMIPGNGRFLYSAFSIFNNEDIIRFFESLGVKLKEEDNGRMFPVSNDAQSVVQALLNKLQQLGVEIKTNAPVETTEYDETTVKGVSLKDGTFLKTKNIIIAAGGKSVPYTGSEGDAYPWAEKAGHTITELFPTEVPIVSNEAFIQNKTLQGLSLRDVSLSVLNKKGKTIIHHRGDMIFTHFGVSGPISLRCSQFVVKELRKANTVTMEIDLLPDQTEESIRQHIGQLSEKEPKKAIKNALKGWLPERMLLFLLEKAEIDAQLPMNQCSKQQVQHLIQLVKHFSFSVHGTLSIEKAFVTGGGVSTKEINPKTMESKIKKGLYFCGEILDIHGYTGGFNITAALVTGRIAGMSAGNKKS